MRRDLSKEKYTREGEIDRWGDRYKTASLDYKFNILRVDARR